MIKKKPWLYRLEKDYSYSSHHLRSLIDLSKPPFNRSSYAGYGGRISLGLDEHDPNKGRLIIRTGYAWDGCTPKFSILGLVVLGVPDGRLRHNVPMTYHASLVHDALCQFRHEIPITKQQVNAIFNDMLWEVGFPLRRLYVGAVNKFGPQDFIREDGL